MVRSNSYIENTEKSPWYRGNVKNIYVFGIRAKHVCYSCISIVEKLILNFNNSLKSFLYKHRSNGKKLNFRKHQEQTYNAAKQLYQGWGVTIHVKKVDEN